MKTSRRPPADDRVGCVPRLPPRSHDRVIPVSLTAALLLLTLGCDSGEGITDGGEATRATVLNVHPPSATLTPGETMELDAVPRDADGNAVPGVTISWTSGDASVATVDGDGAVTAQSAGSTTITATAEEDGGDLSERSEVIVEAEDDDGGASTSGSVASVEVSPASTAVEAGSSVQFVAEVRDPDGHELDRSVAWSSTSPSVTTVDSDGIATAESEGTAEIVATAEGAADSASLTVNAASSGGGGKDVDIPAAGDWSLLTAGAVVPGGGGAWDERFPHGTPGPVLEKDGTYYLYYVGADGDRSSDGGPAHRAVGVATSSSLAGPWSKSSSNPVIPWSGLNENGDEEEGAWRLAGLVDRDGTFLLYVTVLNGSGGNVNGSIQLFTSSDGVDFTDRGVVIDHADSSFPGSDELGVLGAWRENDTYYLNYTAKGGVDSEWSWSLATGGAPAEFSDGRVISETDSFGHGTEPVLKSAAELVTFMGDNGGEFWAYTAPRSDPFDISGKQEAYAGLSSDQFAIVLDRDSSAWYGFFTSGSRGDSEAIDIYTAPAHR